jgi:hypothetical protein
MVLHGQLIEERAPNQPEYLLSLWRSFVPEESASQHPQIRQVIIAHWLHGRDESPIGRR